MQGASEQIALVEVVLKRLDEVLANIRRLQREIKAAREQFENPQADSNSAVHFMPTIVRLPCGRTVIEQPVFDMREEEQELGTFIREREELEKKLARLLE